MSSASSSTRPSVSPSGPCGRSGQTHIAFVPSPCRNSATYAVNPCTTLTTVIVLATAITIPSTVNIDRIWFVRSCSSAFLTFGKISMRHS